MRGTISYIDGVLTIKGIDFPDGVDIINHPTGKIVLDSNIFHGPLDQALYIENGSDNPFGIGSNPLTQDVKVRGNA
jgi:hypothetical protein